MGVREIERFLGQWQMDARDLRQRMIRSPTPRERERWYALLLLAQGWTGSAIATTLERDPHTIGRWALKKFGLVGVEFLAALIFAASATDLLHCQGNPSVANLRAAVLKSRPQSRASRLIQLGPSIRLKRKVVFADDVFELTIGHQREPQKLRELSATRL